MAKLATVYLAGPITGCTDYEANDWRGMVAADLSAYDIIGISPLRCEPLRGERYQLNYADPKFGTPQAIGSKNVFDVQRCDMVLAYLPKPEEGRRQSYGTLGEVAWARMLNKPVVIISDDPDIIGHPVYVECAGWIVPRLEDAVDIIVGVLAGYVGGKNI